LTGKKPDFLEADLADEKWSSRIIDAARKFDADSGIHLAGLKAVGESVAEPVRYYKTNITSALTLLEALAASNAKTLVFSSSATVYGDLTGATNPYGRTKLFIEEILKDAAIADARWKICNLRYFNPVGAHSSGRIGEDPNGVPNNLFPFIAQVAVGRRQELSVWGDDYKTRDGTGIRDYIHVVDLAAGHLAALDYLTQAKAPGAIDVNLGTGNGVSVLEAIGAFKRASNRDIAYKIAPRREGDIAEIYADASHANKLFNWNAKRTLDDMCQDHWRWQSQNPDGYKISSKE